jgi:hypothetical protein
MFGVPILGIILKIFPPNRDIMLRKEANILPTKNALKTLSKSFLVEMKSRAINVRRNIDPILKKPALNL